MARPRSCRLSSNCGNAGMQISQPFFALGQLDFGLGGLAVSSLPLRFQPGHLVVPCSPGGSPCRPVAASVSWRWRRASASRPPPARASPAARCSSVSTTVSLGVEVPAASSAAVSFRRCSANASLASRLRPAALRDRPGGGRYRAGTRRRPFLPGQPLVQFAALTAKGAELAAAGNNAHGRFPRADHQCAIGLQEFAGQGDEAQSAAGCLRQCHGMGQVSQRSRSAPAVGRPRGRKRPRLSTKRSARPTPGCPQVAPGPNQPAGGRRAKPSAAKEPPSLALSGCVAHRP